jgi:hypothetical protein
VTLVEFRLAPDDGGTRQTIRESGYAALPHNLRQHSFRINDAGWNDQVYNSRHTWMLDAEHARRMTPIFAALGDTTRLYLVHRLAEGQPQSIAHLAGGWSSRTRA